MYAKKFHDEMYEYTKRSCFPLSFVYIYAAYLTVGYNHDLFSVRLLTFKYKFKFFKKTEYRFNQLLVVTTILKR